MLFGGLFLAADVVFKRLVTGALPDLSHVWAHAFVAVAIAWAAAGLLRDLVATREDRRVLPGDTLVSRRVALGVTEIAIALGALDLLFAAFVAVQFRYLFGGPGGATYAHYARHGFFELVAVSVLVLPVLLAANGLARGRLVRGLSFVLVALELAVAASALKRLWLYQQQFGLTELRIYTSGVVIWLACVFVWLCVTTLRGRRRFAVGALVLGFVFTAGLNVLDPDALIARTNLSRPHVDVRYLGHLSDDAVPTLVERLPTLRPAVREELVFWLSRRERKDGGVLAWNASRSRARGVLNRLVRPGE
jgi:hypothetical protein